MLRMLLLVSRSTALFQCILYPDIKSFLDLLTYQGGTRHKNTFR